MNARQSPRLLGLALFATLCALLTCWVLTLSPLRSLGAPREAYVAQTDALETGAAVTLFGGGPQNGPCDTQITGVVADLADGSGAAIVSMDDGVPQAVHAGKSLSSGIELMEIRARSVVVERNGACREIPLLVNATAGVSPANRNTSVMPLPPAGAAAPLSALAMSPVLLVADSPVNTAIPSAMLPIVPTQINTGDEPVSQEGGIVGPRHRTAVAVRKGDTPQSGVGQ